MTNLGSSAGADTQPGAVKSVAHRHTPGHIDGYVVFNPRDLPVDDLPVIYGFNNGGSPGWYSAVLLAEDGTGMGGHLCSHEAFMLGDLGIREGARPDRHEGFREHYPDGYRMAFIPSDEVAAHKGLDLACQRNVAMAEADAKATAWGTGMSSSLADARTQPGSATSVAHLIERLEAATEGSRALDAAIAEALGWTVHNARRGGLWAVTDGRRYEDLSISDEDMAVLISIDVWTQSIDAALALAERVLPRWGVDIGFPCRLGEHGGRPWASVWPPNNSGLEPALNDKWGRCNPANAAGLPLALCIAILRATPPLSDRTGGEK